MSFTIKGTGICVPEKVVTNDDLAKLIDTNDEWIVTRTGIKARRVATTETAKSMSVEACTTAIKNSKIDPKDIDLVICATMKGDTFTPSLACVVASKLGIVAPAFDINAACTGILYAFDIAKMYFDNGKAKNILVFGCELLSRLVDWKDRSTCILFGDGAAASVLSKGKGMLASHIIAEPNDEMIIGHSYEGKSPYNHVVPPDRFLHMAGQEVYKFAVKTMVAEIEKVLEMSNLTIEDIDYLMPHQANQRIVDAAVKKLNMDASKVVRNIDKYGNMSAVSVLSLLAESDGSGKLKKGNKILMVAFGAGMTAGACVLDWQK